MNSDVSARAQWIRPPDIRFSGINIPSSNAVQISPSSVSLNMSLVVGVRNPNWFGANFKEIKAV